MNWNKQNKLMQNGLSEKQVDQIKDIFNANENILEVILFGSRAKGTFKKGSDVVFCWNVSVKCTNRKNI